MAILDAGPTPRFPISWSISDIFAGVRSKVVAIWYWEPNRHAVEITRHGARSPLIPFAEVIDPLSERSWRRGIRRP